MAKETAAQPGQKTDALVRVRVVSNYGSHRPGEWIEVSEREYLKFRRDDGAGSYLFPVFISEADLAAQKVKQEKEETARVESQRNLDERSRSEGWQEYQRKSLEIVRAQRIEQQKAQHATLLGTPAATLTPEQQQAQFRERVAAARTG